MTQALLTERATIFIVDNDAAVRDALTALFVGLDVCVKTYPSAEAYLSESPAQANGCLIIDLHLPGMNGLELMNRLRAMAIAIPTIVLASDSDVPLAVRAMRAGAIDFIDKPFVAHTLLSRVRQALKLSRTDTSY